MSTVFAQIGNAVGTELNTMRTNLASDLDATKAQVATDLATTQTQVASDLDATKAQVATDLATTQTQVATDLATTKAQVATDLATTKAQVATDLATTKAQVATDLATTQTQVTAHTATMVETVGNEILLKKDMVPADPTVSLGTLAKPFADVFISESSLYVNGTKVLSENAGTIDISADLDQNIRISTQGAGDIEFFPSALGVIQLKGSVSIPSTKLLLTSDGLPMNFGQGIVVDGNVVSDNVTTLTNRVSSLETLTSSNDLNLDTIQEIVTFIQTNRADLDSISLDWSALQNVPTMYTEAEVGTITEFDNALATAMA